MKMRVNVRRWEMHRDGEGIAVVPSCTSKYFLLFLLYLILFYCFHMNSWKSKKTTGKQRVCSIKNFIGFL